MDNNILISVIVPVYNGEKFVHRAIDSVLCQFDGRIELILINDGSVDNSGAICDEYASKHSNIHVIHKPNGGTSSAKNAGIRIARGKYLSFLDCDDYLDSDTFSKIIPILLDLQPDCLDFGLKYINPIGEVTENIHQCPKNELLTQEYLDTVILPPLLNLRKDDAHFVFDFCCNKIFNAEIIREYLVLFDEEKRTWEDRIFLLRHLKHCRNYYAMSQSFYNYVYTPNSLSQRYSLDFFNIILANFQHYRDLFCDRFDFDTPYANHYRANAINNMIIRSLEQSENQEIIANNIRDALKHPQVVYWFTNSTFVDKDLQKVQQYISSGNIEQVLVYYTRRKRKKKTTGLLSVIKGYIKKALGLANAKN